MRIGLLTALLSIACASGCRQQNPDWMGPGDLSVGEASSSGGGVTSTGTATQTNGGTTDAATGSGGGSGSGPGCDPATELFCGGQCKNVMTDRKNCGECGNMCTANGQCIDGVCS